MNPDKLVIKYRKPARNIIDHVHIDMFWMVSEGKLSELYDSFESVRPEDVPFYIRQRDNEGRGLIHYSW